MCYGDLDKEVYYLVSMGVLYREQSHSQEAGS